MAVMPRDREQLGRRDWYGPDPREPSRTERRLLAASGVASLASRSLTRRRGRSSDARDAPTYRKVFVVGCGRSGTTWVQECLSTPATVTTTQESHAYENIYDPIRRLGNSPIAWARIVHHYLMDRRRQRWAGLYWWVTRRQLTDIAAAALAEGASSPEQTAQRAIHAVFDTWYSEHARPGQVLLEKTPGHIAYAHLILEEFADARIVEVMRDGRDVCVSLEKHAQTMHWPPTTRDAQIRMWKRCVEAGERLRLDPALGPRVFRVHYEDLRARPHRELSRLFEALDIAVTPTEIAEIVDVHDMSRVARRSEGGHRRKGAVGDWRTELSAEDVARFDELAGELARRVGYDDLGRVRASHGEVG